MRCTTRRSASSPRPAPRSGCSPPSTRVAGGRSRRLRGRFAVYNERVREIADRHGAVVLDSWRMRPEHPELMWSEDRLHLGPLGHQAVAVEVLDTLGVPHDVVLSDPTGSLARPPSRPGGEPTSSGRCGTPRPGSSGASPGGPPATASLPNGRVWSRSDGSQSLGYDPSRRSAGTADVAQLVERDLPKVDVASSNLVIRSESSDAAQLQRKPRERTRIHMARYGRRDASARRSGARARASGEARPTRRPARPAGFETVAERPPQPAAGGFREAEATELRPRATPFVTPAALGSDACRPTSPGSQPGPRLLRRPRGRQHPVVLGEAQGHLRLLREAADGRAVRRAAPRSSARPRSSGPTATCASPRTRRRTRPPRAPSSASARPPGGTSRSRRAASAPAPGFYDATGPRIAAIRAAIDDDRTGTELEPMLEKLEGGGWRDRRARAQDRAARVRPEPPADRAAPPQVADDRARLRLRADHPHPRAARGRARRLAHAPARSSTGSPPSSEAGAR